MQDVKGFSTYKESLREKVLSETMEAFSKYGIKAVKMDDIANKLSISKRTLYEMYGNKEDLLLEGLKKYMDERRQRLTDFASQADNVMDILLYSFRVTLEELRDTSPLFFSDMMMYPKVRSFFDVEYRNRQDESVDFMLRGVAEGYFRPDVNYELLASVIDAQHHHIMAMQLNMKYSFEDIFFNLIFVYLRGFCTSKGIDVLESFLQSYKQ